MTIRFTKRKKGIEEGHQNVTCGSEVIGLCAHDASDEFETKATQSAAADMKKGHGNHHLTAVGRSLK